jgi:hypothetical protein
MPDDPPVSISRVRGGSHVGCKLWLRSIAPPPPHELEHRMLIRGGGEGVCGMAWHSLA